MLKDLDSKLLDLELNEPGQLLRGRIQLLLLLPLLSHQVNNIGKLVFPMLLPASFAPSAYGSLAKSMR